MTTTSGGGEIEISAEMEASAMAAASAAGAQIVIEKVEQCFDDPTSYHACVLLFQLHGVECFESDKSIFIL